MKKIVLLMLALSIQSCKIKYYGYVYDFDTEKPIEGVKINGNNTVQFTKSKKNGYFEIEFKEKEKVLLFSKNEYQSHDLKTVSIQNGEQMKELPLGDTIYLISNRSKHKRPQRK